MFKRKPIQKQWQLPEGSFSSNHVAAIAGCSLRQLQWWDEQHFLTPHHEGHRRIYSAAEVEYACVLTTLRKKQFSLQQLRRMRRAITFSINDAHSEFENGKQVYLATDGQNARKTIDMSLLLDFKRPVTLVYLNPIFSIVKARGEDSRRSA